MEEQMKEIFIPYTYTYDQFTVFFYGDRIFVGEKDFPTGQCSVDMMNLREDILNTIDHRGAGFFACGPAASDRKNRQRRSFRTGEAERCLGCGIYFAGLPGSEDG